MTRWASSAFSTSSSRSCLPRWVLPAPAQASAVTGGLGKEDPLWEVPLTGVPAFTAQPPVRSLIGTNTEPFSQSFTAESGAAGGPGGGLPGHLVAGGSGAAQGWGSSGLVRGDRRACTQHGHPGCALSPRTWLQRPTRGSSGGSPCPHLTRVASLRLCMLRPQP